MLNELNDAEKVEVLNEMIDDLCHEFDMSTKNAIDILAAYYEIDKKDLVELMREQNSIFVSNNPIIYYDDRGVAIKRTNHLAKVMKTIEKIGLRIKKMNIDVNVEEMMDIIREDYGVFYAIG